MKQHKWEKKLFEGTELFGKTLGIIGCGRIGLEVAKRAVAFGMTVLVYDIIPVKTDLALKQVPLDELLSKADLITVHVPKQPRPLLGDAEFANMKKGVIIVNTGRGKCIDEPALARALADGHVRAYATDVWTSDPPPADCPLLGVLIPHTTKPFPAIQFFNARDFMAMLFKTYLRPR